LVILFYESVRFLGGFTSGSLVCRPPSTGKNLGGNNLAWLLLWKLPDLKATGGLVLEKLEGLTVLPNGSVVVNDNDGVDDSNGETQLMFFDNLF